MEKYHINSFALSRVYSRVKAMQGGLILRDADSDNDSRK